MTRRILASMAFAFLLACSIQPSLSQTYGHRVARHSHAAQQNIAALRAAVPEQPTVFPSARPHGYPYNFHETDGLSRNPNDCVVWGCIDSN
jgi:hypothetical protein